MAAFFSACIASRALTMIFSASSWALAVVAARCASACCLASEMIVAASWASLDQLVLVLGEHALGLDACLLGLLEGLADGRLAFHEHAVKQGPPELREDDPKDDEGDEHGDEFVHLGQDRVDAPLRSECICRASQCKGRREHNGAADPCCLILAFQLRLPPILKIRISHVQDD